jgi:hypothetical protein
MRILLVLAIAIFMGTLAVGQNHCAQSPQDSRSKADCEEAAKVIESWNQSCLKVEREGGIFREVLSAKDDSQIALCTIESAKEITKAVLDTHQSDEQV